MNSKRPNHTHAEHSTRWEALIGSRDNVDQRGFLAAKSFLDGRPDRVRFFHLMPSHPKLARDINEVKAWKKRRSIFSMPNLLNVVFPVNHY